MTKQFEPQASLSGLQVRWIDLFPWLAATIPADESDWSGSVIDLKDRVANDQFFSEIAALAIRHLKYWELGDIFPRVLPDWPVERISSNTRVQNVLRQQRCATVGDILDRQVADISDWRNVGTMVVDSIFQGLARHSVEVADLVDVATVEVGTAIATDDDAVFDKSMQEAAARLFFLGRPALRQLVADIETIAAWNRTLGLQSGRIIGEDLLEGTPANVREARERIDEITASEIFPDIQDTELDAPSLLSLALSELDERELDVLDSRMFFVPGDENSKAPTLEEVGARWGVTRERVRQVEGKARARMLTAMSRGELGAVALAARSVVGVVSPVEELLRKIPVLAKEVAVVGKPAWFVLDRLDDDYEIEDGWCATPTVAEAKERTKVLLEDLSDDYGLVELDTIDIVTTLEEHKETKTKEWLEYCGYLVDEKTVLTRSSNQCDLAAAILIKHGRPMSIDDIFAAMARGSSVRSLAQRLAEDPRFVRSDRNSWALKSWGTEEYSNIRELIREIIEQNNGSVDVEQLVKEITSRFDVRPNSVVAYASAPPFELIRRKVRLADNSPKPKKSPHETKNLYRTPAGWSYRIKVSSDHLRGSGSVAPMAVASILNLEYGETRELQSTEGPQHVYWSGISPGFGTIRKFLMKQDVEVGSQAFLCLNDDGTFDFRVAREPVADVLADSMGLIDAPPADSPETALQALALAVGLPSDAGVDQIWFAYADRGESDLENLVQELGRLID